METVVALVTRDVVVGEDPVPLSNADDAFTHGGYDPYSLMPEDRQGCGVFAPGLLDVGSAEAAHLHLDQELTYADLGNWNLRNPGAN